MKVTILPDHGVMTLNLDDDIAQIRNVKTRAYATFGAMLQTWRAWASMRVEQPTEFKNGRSVFFWHTLDEHQGAFELFPVLIGDFTDEEIKKLNDSWWEAWSGFEETEGNENIDICSDKPQGEEARKKLQTQFLRLLE